MQETLAVTPEILEALDRADAPFEVDKTDRLILSWVEEERDLPSWAPREALERFFHEEMSPWHDSLEDVGRGLDYAFSRAEGKGGFVLVAGLGGQLVGAVAVLHTGMGGFVPEHLLLFICVDPTLRGCGLGKTLITGVARECGGAIKLHVEPDNPARRLYERCGFVPQYVEMRRPPLADSPRH